MTTSSPHRTITPRRRAVLTALASLGALGSLAACGGTTQSAGTATAPAPLPTIGVTAPATVPATATETTAPTTPPSAPPTTPAPPPPTPAPTLPPPPPPPPPPVTQPPTTQPPTTTEPPPVSQTLSLDSFQTNVAEEGSGYLGNVYSLDPANRRVQVGTVHATFAVAESAKVQAWVYSTFSPPSPEATLTWNVSWSGYTTAFVGADAAAQGRVTVRVREANRGTVVFERVLEDDGVGAALQGVATLSMNDSDSQSVVLPPLDPSKRYEVEAELECRSRVAFSIGATACDFSAEATSGLRVNDWSIRFDNVPAS